VLPLAPRFLTVHAAGGTAMLAAARQAAEAAGAGRPLLLGVTVLTSMDDAALERAGVPGGSLAQTLRLGRLALAAGADGLVCSAHEVAPLRLALGIRPAGAGADDQRRTLSPREAARAGADWVVVGRPITAAADPAAAAAAIAADLAA
jgi:orotidine-5'-phosphate decarboxylase